MREIKFRGINVENGEMIFGYYAYKDLTDEHFIVVPTFDSYSDKRPQYFINYLVKSETVSPFTGFKDKNGKEVYEGDIILVLGIKKIVVEYGIQKVYEEFGEWEYMGYNIPVSYTDYPLPEKVELEVIGNIYENPEILK